MYLAATYMKVSMICSVQIVGDGQSQIDLPVYFIIRNNSFDDKSERYHVGTRIAL